MEILRKYFPGLSPQQLDQYRLLQDQVLAWNKRINLVSRKDTDFLCERHILHSLAIALHAPFSPEDKILDVGTGGGFPGLPLALMFPESHFVLIDSIGKKINAVSEISRKLRLQNVECFQVRAENYSEKVDHVISRAVTNLGRFTEWISGNLIIPAGDKATGTVAGQGTYSPGGIWYLKGGDLEEELKAFPAARVIELKNDFSEPFFETKKLVWISSNSLA